MSYDGDILPCGHPAAERYFHPGLVGASRWRCPTCDQTQGDSMSFVPDSDYESPPLEIVGSLRCVDPAEHDALKAEVERLREQVEFYQQVIATHYVIPVNQFDEMVESVQTAINSRWDQ